MSQELRNFLQRCALHSYIIGYLYGQQAAREKAHGIYLYSLMLGISIGILAGWAGATL